MCKLFYDRMLEGNLLYNKQVKERKGNRKKCKTETVTSIDLGLIGLSNPVHKHLLQGILYLYALYLSCFQRSNVNSLKFSTRNHNLC